MAETSSLGFRVIPERNMATSPNDKSFTTASGSSEGFRSAYTSPVLEHRDEVRPSSTVSVESASFHTPEPFLSSSQEDQDTVDDVTVQIPGFDEPHNRDRYDPDQPKLLLADDGVEGRMEKQPLDKEYSNHGNYQSRSHDHSHQNSNESTPLLNRNTDDDKTNCCLLL